MDKPSPVVAIVGGTSLLGREIRDVLSSTRMQVRLIGADEAEAGTLTEEGGEPVVMTALDEDNLSAAKVAFLTGSAESTKQALAVRQKLTGPRPALVDLTYGLEDHPTAHLRAPLVEPASYTLPPDTEHVIAHPAAILLAVFLVRLHQIRPVRRSVAHVFEPASERGQRGISELQRQTTNLLTFQKLPKDVYDEQAAFNMLARFGSDAPESLDAIETRIEKHLASLLAINGHLPMPSLRLIQAPVFHGHSASIWVEFEENPGTEALEQALASEHIDVRGPDLDPPNNVGVAGQDGIAVGAISSDRNDPRAAWFWLVADNIRLMAQNAAAVAEQLAGRKGTGKAQ